MAGSSAETWHSCTYSQWEPSASPLPTPTPRARSTWTRRGRCSCARTTAPRAPGGRLQRLLSEGYRHPLRQRYSCRVANRVGVLRAPAPPHCALIHRSAWNRNSANFAFWAFSEVRRFLGTLTCFVPWRTYIPLSQEYIAFVT